MDPWPFPSQVVSSTLGQWHPECQISPVVPLPCLGTCSANKSSGNKCKRLVQVFVLVLKLGLVRMDNECGIPQLPLMQQAPVWLPFVSSSLSPGFAVVDRNTIKLSYTHKVVCSKTTVHGILLPP